MGRPAIDLTGKKIGRLKVIRRDMEAIGGSNRHVRWICQCECGKIKSIFSHSLKGGHTLSCGCKQSEEVTARNTTHGLYYSLTYESWHAMIQRCTNPKLRAWRWYGARGITICKRWLKFENFYADMGERPRGLTLDRKNNDGHYNQTNCRWATWSEQNLNRRPPSKKVA